MPALSRAWVPVIEKDMNNEIFKILKIINKGARWQIQKLD